MRWLGALFSSLTMLCLFCAPALAQSSPSASQYQGGGSGYCPPDRLCVQSLGDSADSFSENAEQGADAVNDAMGEPGTSASAAAGDVSAPAATASGEGAAGESDPDGDTGGLPGGSSGGITELPETGGAPLTVLGSGAVLATLGLMARRVVGR